LTLTTGTSSGSGGIYSKEYLNQLKNSQSNAPPPPPPPREEEEADTTRPLEERTEEEIEYYAPPKGQALLAGLLQDNFDICQDIKAREGEEDVARGPLQPIYDRLSEIKAQLERLVLTHRWTLRETDLYNFQNELSRVDGLRVEGKFRDSQGNVPEGQIVLLYLLRRCYGLCYRLMASSEPVSEELMPIANVKTRYSSLSLKPLNSNADSIVLPLPPFYIHRN